MCLLCQSKAVLLKSNHDGMSLSWNCENAILMVLMFHVVLQAQNISEKIETNIHKFEPEHIPGMNVWNWKRAAQTTMPDEGYIFFSFHKMAWLQFRYTENSAHSHWYEMKPNRRDSAASSLELATEDRPFVYMSLPIFIFTIAFTLGASHPLFVWLVLFPLPPIA